MGSNTLEHKNRDRKKVPEGVRDIKDVSNAALHVQNLFEVLEVTAGCTFKFVLPGLPHTTSLQKNTSPFLAFL